MVTLLNWATLALHHKTAKAQSNKQLYRSYETFIAFFRTMMGTFTHMAPERFANENVPYSFKCEVWALGVVVYEIMARELPVLIIFAQGIIHI